MELTQLQKYDNDEMNPYYHLFTSQQKCTAHPTANDYLHGQASQALHYACHSLQWKYNRGAETHTDDTQTGNSVIMRG